MFTKPDTMIAKPENYYRKEILRKKIAGSDQK
jgi:hypothetical protein